MVGLIRFNEWGTQDLKFFLQSSGGGGVELSQFVGHPLHRAQRVGVVPCLVCTEERTGFRSDVKVNRRGFTGLEGNLFEALQFAVRTGAAADDVTDVELDNFLAQTFADLIPLSVAVFVFWAGSVLFKNATGMLFSAWILEVFKPLFVAADGYIGIAIIYGTMPRSSAQGSIEAALPAPLSA